MLESGQSADLHSHSAGGAQPRQGLERLLDGEGLQCLSGSFLACRADPTADTRADPAWQQLSLDEAMGLLLKEGAFGSSPDLRKHIGEGFGCRGSFAAGSCTGSTFRLCFEQGEPGTPAAGGSAPSCL